MQELPLLEPDEYTTEIARVWADELWAAIEPLLPKERPRPKGGRPRVGDRAALAGTLFVLKTGIS